MNHIRRSLLAIVALLAVLAVSVWLTSATAHAEDGSDLLDGSTNALIVGPTGFPDVSQFPGYIPTVDTLYLDPLGYGGTGATTLPLVVPDTSDYGPSVTEGEADVVTAVEADYNAGLLSPDDPLTLMGYSQGATDISGAEQALADFGVPEEDLRIVLIGDPSNPLTGILATLAEQPTDAAFLDDIGWGNLVGLTTPDDLYPTNIYTITGDKYGDWTANDPNAALIHDTYLGLTEAEIQAATEQTDGLTNYFTIATPDLLTTLSDTVTNIFG